MRPLPFLALALAFLLSSLATRAHAQAGYEPSYYGAQPLQPPLWTSEDEEWLNRNRTIALAGKIMTVLGVAALVAGSMADDAAVLWGPGLAVQTVGQFVWSIAELRGAKGLQRRGIEVTKAPGIAAVVGAVLLSPVTWIAGPIQSARIREVRSFLVDPTGTPSYGRRLDSRVASYGLGLTLSF